MDNMFVGFGNVPVHVEDERIVFAGGSGRRGIYEKLRAEVKRFVYIYLWQRPGLSTIAYMRSANLGPTRSSGW